MRPPGPAEPALPLSYVVVLLTVSLWSGSWVVGELAVQQLPPVPLGAGLRRPLVGRREHLAPAHRRVRADALGGGRLLCAMLPGDSTEGER